jgi:hypothetical protein
VRISRRAFLAASGMAAVPLIPLRVAAAPGHQPLAVGELWGMPYSAPGALGNLPANLR